MVASFSLAVSSPVRTTQNTALHALRGRAMVSKDGPWLGVHAYLVIGVARPS